jgi:hypothetical protein
VKLLNSFLIGCVFALTCLAVHCAYETKKAKQQTLDALSENEGLRKRVKESDDRYVGENVTLQFCQQHARFLENELIRLKIERDCWRNKAEADKESPRVVGDSYRPELEGKVGIDEQSDERPIPKAKDRGPAAVAPILGSPSTVPTTFPGEP